MKNISQFNILCLLSLNFLRTTTENELNTQMTHPLLANYNRLKTAGYVRRFYLSFWWQFAITEKAAIDL